MGRVGDLRNADFEAGKTSVGKLDPAPYRIDRSSFDQLAVVRRDSGTSVVEMSGVRLVWWFSWSVHGFDQSPSEEFSEFGFSCRHLIAHCLLQHSILCFW